MSHITKLAAGISWLLIFFWLAGPISALAENRQSADEIVQSLLPPKIIVMGPAKEPRRIEHDMLIPFELNQYFISPNAVPHLQALGEALRNEKLRGYIFEIQGHTCDLGSDAFNLILSEKRAASIKDYLVTNYSISPDQIKTEGFGKKNPKADNSTEEGRRQNRRVTVVNTLKPFKASERHLLSKIRAEYRRGKETVELKEGETLTAQDNYSVSFISEVDCHVYVFQVDSDSKIHELFPAKNYSRKINPVKSGHMHRIPEIPDSWICLDNNKGKEEIIVVASLKSLDKPETVCRRIIEGEIKTMGPRGPRTVLNNDPNDLFIWRLPFNHQ